MRFSNQAFFFSPATALTQWLGGGGGKKECSRTRDVSVVACHSGASLSEDPCGHNLLSVPADFHADHLSLHTSQGRRAKPDAEQTLLQKRFPLRQPGCVCGHSGQNTHKLPRRVTCGGLGAGVFLGRRLPWPAAQLLLPRHNNRSRWNLAVFHVTPHRHEHFARQSHDPNPAMPLASRAKTLLKPLA